MKKSIIALLIVAVASTPAWSVDFGGGFAKFSYLKSEAHKAFAEILGAGYTKALKTKAEDIMNNFTHPMSEEEKALGIAVNDYTSGDKQRTLIDQWMGNYLTGTKVINYGSGVKASAAPAEGNFGGGYSDIVTIRADMIAYVGQILAQNRIPFVVPLKKKGITWIMTHIDTKYALGQAMTAEDKSLGVALEAYQQGNKAPLNAWTNAVVTNVS